MSNWLSKTIRAIGDIYTAYQAVVYLIGAGAVVGFGFRTIGTDILTKTLGQWHTLTLATLGIEVATMLILTFLAGTKWATRKSKQVVQVSVQPTQSEVTIMPPYFFEHAGFVWKSYPNSRDAHGPLCPTDRLEIRPVLGNTWKCANDHKFVLTDVYGLRQFACTITSKNYDEMLIRWAEEEKRRPKAETETIVDKLTGGKY